MSSNFEPNNPKRQPDEFISIMGRVSFFAVRHRNTLVILLAVIALSVVGTLIVKSKKESNLKILNQEVFEASRAEDPVKALETLASKHDDSQGSFAIHLALFEKYREAKNLDKAKQELLLAQKNAPEFLTQLLEYSYAQILWQEGKADEALQALGDDKSNTLGNNQKYLKAVLLESTHKIPEAKKVYGEIIAQKDQDPFVVSLASVSRLDSSRRGRSEVAGSARAFWTRRCARQRSREGTPPGLSDRAR